jgi:hypothetical protein
MRIRSLVLLAVAVSTSCTQFGQNIGDAPGAQVPNGEAHRLGFTLYGAVGVVGVETVVHLEGITNDSGLFVAPRSVQAHCPDGACEVLRIEDSRIHLVPRAVRVRVEVRVDVSEGAPRADAFTFDAQVPAVRVGVIPVGRGYGSGGRAPGIVGAHFDVGVEATFLDPAVNQRKGCTLHGMQVRGTDPSRMSLTPAPPYAPPTTSRAIALRGGLLEFAVGTSGGDVPFDLMNGAYPQEVRVFEHADVADHFLVAPCKVGPIASCVSESDVLEAHGLQDPSLPDVRFTVALESIFRTRDGTLGGGGAGATVIEGTQPILRTYDLFTRPSAPPPLEVGHGVAALGWSETPSPDTRIVTLLGDRPRTYRIVTVP